ncbi:hypothetical protein FSP39_002429 [Pinctada imbricata]|uniref:Phospholipase A2 n=1 Tax=Pinctada imbricata TaxID=66713 RepID=A0AA88XKN5_PINIB|nr:hypothetical protein FSP39_002429 [Pinctada imbricata]
MKKSTKKTLQGITTPYVSIPRDVLDEKCYIITLVDTPDPYVILHISNAPNCYQRTVTKDNDVNPEWNETFKFYLDPMEQTSMEVTLMDGNYLYPDEMLGNPTTFPFEKLPYDNKIEKTFHFNERFFIILSCEPQLRFSLSLCDEERAFIERRKKKVMEAMYEVLGDDAPTKLHEVPSIGIIGSGGGFRAMSAYSGVWSALVDSRIMDMVTFAAGLSGSAWYIAQLYSHPDFPSRTPGELQAELGRNIEHSPVRLLGLSSVYNYITRICEKRKQGQPISFTDLFGHLVGETLLKDRDEPRLTDQQAILKKADVPLPLYTCLHVKKHISAMVFHEWMEFSPYEIGLPKYGTFLKPQLFGGKFFMGQLVKQYQEPPLHFLLGVWGSAFCIQFNRLLKDDKKVKGCEEVEAERMELEKELVQDLDCQSSEESETSESEMDDTGERKVPKKKDKNKKDKPRQEVPFWTDVLGKFFSKNHLLKTIEGRAAKVHSFMRGLSMNKVYPFSPFTSFSQEEISNRFSFGSAHQFKGIFDMYPTTMKKLYVVDGGLTFNSPYPLLLRPQRQVDIILSFDFSARPSDSSPPFKEILLAKEWAKLNNVPFPPIDPRVFDREGMKECYVFEDPDDPRCPTVLHFVLVNITFREEVLPGRPRTTTEEKEFADFDIFDDPDKPYSTFNFKYSKLAFDRLTKLMEFNTLMFKDLILRKIKECVVRKRENYAKGNRPIKIAEIKKLQESKRRQEGKSLNSMTSFEQDPDDVEPV